MPDSLFPTLPLPPDPTPSPVIASPSTPEAADATTSDNATLASANFTLASAATQEAHAGPAKFPAIPGYEIIGEIGRGGMGVVYQATQIGLDRTVALKMILKADFATATEKLRFQIEAENAARMRHPNIVQVFDIGEYQGQPYFALEFVEGGSLADWLDAHRPSPAAAAMMIETLARAVHAAHLQGIIHRDLKPANVLLDRQHQPKIADFGLAKRLDDSHQLTKSGAIIGTPAYMPPEQARGQGKHVGPAADQYALGVIFYQMLTQRLPFDAASLPSLVKKIVEDEPASPRARNPAVPRDLEVICLKCLAKEPSQRYPSAEALADDLGNWRAHRPIIARPARRWERLAKWCRRYPAVTALILVSTLAATAAGGLATWALTAAAAEKQAKLEAEARQVAAEQAEEETYRAFEQLTGEKSLQFLKTTPELTPEQREFMQIAAEYFRRVAAQAGTDRKSRIRAARGAMNLGYLLAGLQDYEAAAAAYRQAVALNASLAHDQPNEPDFRHEMAGGLSNLGNLLNRMGRHAEAETVFRQALAVLEALSKEDPWELEYRQETAGIYKSLGNLLLALEQRSAAEKAYRRAIAELNELLLGDPTSSQLRNELAGTHNNLGILLVGLGRPHEAEKFYRKALALQSDLVLADAQQPAYQETLASIHNNLGLLLSEAGNLTAAESHYRQAIARRDALVQDFPNVAGYRRDLLHTLRNIGVVLVDLHRPDDAEICFRRALALRERLPPEQIPTPNERMEWAHVHNNLGVLLMNRNDHAEAESAFRAALALKEALAHEFPDVQHYSQSLAGSLVNLGNLARNQGRPAEAINWYARAEQSLAAITDQDAPVRRTLRTVHSERAEALDALGQFADAAAAWEQTLKLNDEAQHRQWIKQRRAASLFLATLSQDQSWLLLWCWPLW